MPLPSNVSVVTLHGKYVLINGNAASGTVTFSQANFLRDPGADTVIVPADVTVTLSGTGEFTVTLPASDDPDLDPTNIVYTVKEQISGATRSFNIILPTTSGTLELADLAPTSGSNPIAWQYVLVSEKGVANGVATLDGTGKVPSSQLPASSGSGYTTIQDEGTARTARAILNFIGGGVAASDNAGSSRTDVAINTAVQDEGVLQTLRSILNFTGAGVTVTDDAANSRTNISIPGGAATGYQIAQEEGVSVTQRNTINFVGPGVTVTDDAANSRTLVTIPDLIIINQQTGNSYTAALGDHGKVIERDSTVANTVMLPSATTDPTIPVGWWTQIRMIGTGLTSITADTGVTIRCRGKTAPIAIAGQWGAVTVTKRFANVYAVDGDIG